jgi:hypothetical protein
MYKHRVRLARANSCCQYVVEDVARIFAVRIGSLFWQSVQYSERETMYRDVSSPKGICDKSVPL